MICRVCGVDKTTTNAPVMGACLECARLVLEVAQERNVNMTHLQIFVCGVNLWRWRGQLRLGRVNRSMWERRLSRRCQSQIADAK